ncbi:MAG: aminopeptidase P family protein [Kiritimatiellae bacterium]|nr:aminopeptidase P family protein [Kiritimatiellia bacterium]
MKKNPFSARLEEFRASLASKGLDAAIFSSPANVRALTGVECDCVTLLVTAEKTVFFTDFRYAPAVARLAPYLEIGDILKFNRAKRPLKVKGRSFKKVGFEPSVSYSAYQRLKKVFPDAEFVDVESDILLLRAVKTTSEIDIIRKAAALNDETWNFARMQFRPGMTERDMARIIKQKMLDVGDGEAFETIVCIGENAAECHHIPDGTKWDGKKNILVDMGVKFSGYASDMTRNIVGPRPSRLYKKVYNLVLEANMRAIAAAKPGMTAAKLDKVARDFLKANGFGEAFGHSLGHGVGLQIHEAPTVSKRDKTVLTPGMVITIEPGVYLPGNLGVRIEDLVLITETGCEVLSSSEK